MKRSLFYPIKQVGRSSLFCLAIILFFQISMAQPIWDCTNGPFGGTVNCLYEDPLTHDIYAGSEFAGIWKSADLGNSWEYLSCAGYTVKSIATNSRGDLFAVFNFRGRRSTDGGATWTECTISSAEAGAVVIDSLMLWSSRGHGVYRSTDYGESWSQASGTQNLDIPSLFMLHDSTILAGTYNNGILRSTDFGATWEPLADTVSRVWQFAEDADYVYAGVRDGGVYRSGDGGLTWDNPSGTSWDVWGIQIDQDGALYFADYGPGVYQSLDQGESWERFNTGLGFYPGPLCLLVTSSQELIEGTYWSGVFKTDLPLVDWHDANQGFDATSIMDFAFAPNGDLWASRFLDFITFTTDQGQNWQYTGMGGIPRTIEINPETGTILAGQSSGHIKRSVDSGQTWTTHYPGEVFNNDVHDFKWNNGVWWVATDNGVFRSDNDGIDWICAGLCIEDAQLKRIAFTAEGTLIAVGYDILRSTDLGATWDTTTTMIINPDLVVSNDNYIYVSTEGPSVIYASNTDGIEWDTLAGPFNPTAITVTSSGDVVLGTVDRGIFRSTDHGVSWDTLNTGIRGTIWPSYEKYPTITKLIADENDYVYIGTHGSCVYKSILPLASDENHLPKQVPTSFTLHQNYPNPFNSTTCISFNMKAPAKAAIQIFNIEGRIIDSWTDVYPIGDHSLTFSAEHLATGTYFAELSVGSFSQVRKMIVLK